MKQAEVHPWNVTPAQAREIQLALQKQVITQDQLGEVRFVAGVDVGLEQENTISRAAIAVLRFPELQLQEYALARKPVTFPYIPGLLSFREIPVILDALGQLNQQPDLLLCDGQGIAHPRRFGIACHLGVLTGVPAIGVAKSRLTGTHKPVADKKGGSAPLLENGETIGLVLRTRKGVKPVYVSPGHKISLQTAKEYVMRCVTRYRLPETTRWAHRLASGPLTDLPLLV